MFMEKIYLVTGKDTVPNTVEQCSCEFALDYLKDLPEIGVDTETDSLDPFTGTLLTLQLGDYNTQFVIDCTTIDITIFKQLLETKILILHNAKFDLRFLFLYKIVPIKVFDTFLAEAVLYMGIANAKKSLEYVCKNYLGIQLHKELRGHIIYEGLTDDVVQYAAHDVKYLKLLKDKQLQEIAKRGLVYALELENRFVIPLAYTEFCGIKLDQVKLAEKNNQDRLTAEKYKTQLNQWLIEHPIAIQEEGSLFSNVEMQLKINWDSPKQVITVFKNLGINTLILDKKTGKEKDSVDSKHIEKYAKKFPIIDLYLKYKESQKLVSTYGDTMFGYINPITNRVHTNFTQILDTGRLSSSPNLQNIPRLPDPKDKEAGKIYERECFVAEKGNCFVDGDFTGQEQVIFANFSKDKNLLEFYKSGESDMHSYIASKIYPYLNNLPLQEIKKKYPKERQEAKSAGFAITYGGNGNTIATNLNIEPERGEFIYNSYFKAFPGIKNYFDACSKFAARNGYILINPVNRRKVFINNFKDFLELQTKTREYGFWETYRKEKQKESEYFLTTLKPLVKSYFSRLGEISRMSYNFPIQGTGAEMTKIATIEFFNLLRKNNLLFVVKIVNLIHDEILIETPLELKEVCKKWLEKCMIQAGSYFCTIIPLKANVVTSTYWEH